MRRSILARFLFPFLLGILPCLLVNSILTVSRGDAAEGNSGKTIDKLIADLRSDRFEIREAATRALKERVEAMPALRKARQSVDLEVRRRAADILSALERKRATRSLAQAKALGKAGRAVEAADRLALAAKYGIAGEEGWESLTQFADLLITRGEGLLPAGCKSYYRWQLPVGDFRRFAKQFHPKEIAKRIIEIDTGEEDDPRDEKKQAVIKFIRDNQGRFLLRGEEVSFTGAFQRSDLDHSIIASSGDAQISAAICSVIVAGGDVEKVDMLIDCILICDGDVELLNRGKMVDSVIVARGNVTWKQGKLLRCLVRSGHRLYLPNGKTIDLKDGTPDPLAFVKFFELADVGIAAEDLPRSQKSDAEGVRLKDVRKESPFAAGLRIGDVITAIEGEKTPTTEMFRRVLRRKLPEGGPLVTFTVRRAGKMMEVPIPVKD